ncbi:MAG: hypothetical protein ACQESB_02220 [Elusimicrobiota bacterium]
MNKKIITLLILMSLNAVSAYAFTSQESYEFRAVVEFGAPDEEPEYLEEKSATIGQGGGVIRLSDGSYIRIPSEALDEKTEILMQKLDLDHSSFSHYSPPVKSEIPSPKNLYRFRPEGLRFKKPVTLHLLAGEYPHNNYNYTLFKRDDFFQEWDMLGGEMKTDESKVFVHAGISSFSIFAIYAVEGLDASDFRPKQRIVTPDEKASFEGLAAQDTTIKMFDVRGRQIRTVTSDSGYKWDGRDDSGRFVESGVYIYQFKAEINGEMELVSGMIAVAR